MCGAVERPTSLSRDTMAPDAPARSGRRGVTPLQAAAYYSSSARSYWAKYPGQTGDQLRQLTDELLKRVAEAQVRT